MNVKVNVYPFLKKRLFKKKRKPEDKKRNYTYVSEDKKKLFLQQFLFEGYKIYEVSFPIFYFVKAASNAGIKYSTAKTILFTHRQIIRNQFIECKTQIASLASENSSQSRCQYRPIGKNETPTKKENELTQETSDFVNQTKELIIVVRVGNVVINEHHIELS